MAALADRVEEWSAKNPLARLAAIAWILLTGLFAVLAFLESYWWAPARAATQLREQAIREGWHADPKVWVSYGLGDCRIANYDPRPIHQVTLARYIFHVVLNASCGGGDYYGGGARANARVLEPGAHLAEDPAIGPSLLEAASQAASQECPPGHDCVVVLECRARYHRAADLKAYSRSGWAVFEPGQPGRVVAAETLVRVEGTPTSTRVVWQRERARETFECVEQLSARRARDEDFLSTMSESSLVKGPR